ncbi:MAG: Two-component DNA-binding response regulator [Candidatus Uhrbacteria bacterium GW2011_GWF2_39_13]|uniref:Two-component DNA-binding response regulator n=1 Tax=Candidatus Uhrbacteria bacterium GW2011_GWF2_39_13 TaxID=1618995 RepID=A0A0G0PYA6_9BACT|nr:MAG: Two-component DNA-binding response regulator [Candidatus Uhrbacteria bacterium GW2011_GWF2_39_13]
MSGEKILLVDDEKDILEYFGKALKREGFRVLTAENGEDSLVLAKRELPDLIVLDVIMQGMDGGEVAQILRETKETVNIPVIFLSAAVQENNEGIVKRYMYIAKVTPIVQIIAKIKEILRNGRVNG